MVPVYDALQQQKKFRHPWRFQEWVGGLNWKRHLEVLRNKMGMDVAPRIELIHMFEGFWLQVKMENLQNRYFYFKNTCFLEHFTSQ